MFISTPKKIQKARKYHVCDWCGETISKGRTYFKWFCYNDDSGETVKAHPECLIAGQESDNPEEAWFNRSQERGEPWQ